VNLDGDRFSEEQQPAVDLAFQRESTGYIVLDDEVARTFNRFPNFISTAPLVAYAYFDDYLRGRRDLVHAARDVASLAVSIGIDASRLARAIASAPSHMSPSLYALGPVRSMVLITEGSATVDEQCRVLREGGVPIPGLFAAGVVGQGGMQLFGHGLHIAWAMTSGRLAGEFAARRLPLLPGKQPFPMPKD
jgi:fumarate reductase flavoprotein subunit